MIVAYEKYKNVHIPTQIATYFIGNLFITVFPIRFTVYNAALPGARCARILHTHIFIMYVHMRDVENLFKKRLTFNIKTKTNSSTNNEIV